MAEELDDHMLRPEDDPAFVERVKTLEGYIGLAAADELAAAEPAQADKDALSQRRRGIGPRLGIFGVAVSLVVLLLILLLFVVATRGTDPTRWLTASERPSTPRAAAPAADGQRAETPNAASAGAHDENAVDHVSQAWAPTQIDAGEWTVALAREEPLVETWSDIGGEPKEGNRALLVDLYVTNGGAEARTIDASFFSLKDSAGNSFAILGLEPQEASSGSPVYVETWYEVPVDTQGLSLHFAPPESLGGKPVDVALPELRY